MKQAPVIDYIRLPAATRQLRGEIEWIGGDIFRQPPSPDVDRAWDDFQSFGHAWVSSDDIIAVGKDPSTAVRFPLEQGFGPDAYPVSVDIFHKIHCLNRIRKEINFDYYWRAAFPDGNATDLHKAHTNHCIHVLLQSLMCDATTDFITYNWAENYPLPVPDFNINRKCGDLHGVAQWSKEHGTDLETISMLRKPDEKKALPMSPELRRLLRLWDG